MKVRALQEQLAKLDPELEVVCYSEDATLVREGRSSIPLEILAVNKAGVERGRFDDGTPYLKFNGSTSDAVAVLEVSSDF